MVETSRNDAFWRETARRLGQAVRAFVTSEVGGRAKALGFLLLALLLGINAVNVLNSYVGRYFMTAIERREWTEFVRMAFLYVGVFAISTCAAVINRYVEERLGLLWREWLTRRLVGIYLDDRMYYRLNAIGTLGHPDQRIADDVRSFTASTLSIALIFLNGTFTIIAFSGVLWSISRLLFATAVGYAALGSVIAVFMGRPLIRLNYDQSDREADFREQLIHVRENAESIALLDRESHIGTRLGRQVDAFAANLKRIITVNRNLSFFTTGYDYLIQIIPALIVAPLFIRREVEFGAIPQASMAFAYLVGAFSLVVKQFPQLSTYAAVLARLNVLVGATETTSLRRSSPITIVEDRDRLAFEHLTLLGADDQSTLVRDLSFEMPPRSNVLITTPNEVTTGALQRAIAGIWDTGEGRVVRPMGNEMISLPDRPYLPPGTLREILGGTTRLNASDQDIWEALRIVAIDDLVRRSGGLDVERDWDELLSSEEQRLFSMARILLLRPRFAVLARIHASLGGERAAHLLDLLCQRGVGCMVLGEATPSGEQRDIVIAIASDGSWTERPGSRSTPDRETPPSRDAS